MSTETPRGLRVLRIDASMRKSGSATRALTDRLIEKLTPASVETLDLADARPPFLTEDWISANFTDPDARSAAQKAALAQSDALIDQLEAADVVVIGAPIYNFGVPAALKAWLDLIARARRTFRYTENGPVGLLTGKKAYVLAASGGTAAGSEIDFATPYLKHVLGFVGISDVTIIAADRQMADGGSRAAAEAAIDRLAA